MSLSSRATTALVVALATMTMATSHATMIHDFQDGTFGPWNAAGTPVIAAVVPDDEPDFTGDRAGLVFDPDGGFQVALTMTTGNALALLPALHANSTFQWEVDRASYPGEFAGNHLVFQSNDPIGFNVLDGSFQFIASQTGDQTYSHNYGAGEGRTILNTIDPDQDGDIAEHGFTFFNIYIIQQTTDGLASTMAYDDIRLVPEPASWGLLAIGGLLAWRVRRGRSAS